MAGSDFEPGIGRARSKESSNYNQGKSGGKVMIKKGPAVGNTSGNAMKGGAITSPTRGKLK
jgi:hypothetical protein